MLWSSARHHDLDSISFQSSLQTEFLYLKRRLLIMPGPVADLTVPTATPRVELQRLIFVLMRWNRHWVILPSSYKPYWFQAHDLFRSQLNFGIKKNLLLFCGSLLSKALFLRISESHKILLDLNLRMLVIWARANSKLTVLIKTAREDFT